MLLFLILKLLYIILLLLVNLLLVKYFVIEELELNKIVFLIFWEFVGLMIDVWIFILYKILFWFIRFLFEDDWDGIIFELYWSWIVVIVV